MSATGEKTKRRKHDCVKKPYMFWIIFLFKHMLNLFLTQGQKSPLWTCLPNNRDLRLASLNEHLSSINRYGELFFYLKQCYFGLISVPIWLTFQWSKQQVKSLLLCIVSVCTHEEAPWSCRWFTMLHYICCYVRFLKSAPSSPFRNHRWFS